VRARIIPRQDRVHQPDFEAELVRPVANPLMSEKREDRTDGSVQLAFR
jgi:hypothetical protein